MRNPVLCRVKTRLAATIGDKIALQIYQSLLLSTRQLTAGLKGISRILFYSDFINNDDEWNNSTYQKKIQVGEGLGEILKEAFNQSFREGAEKVVIIGTDCFELTENDINQAFYALNQKDAVIGPTVDGGYYLLGLTKMENSLFENIYWGTNDVFISTFKKMNAKGISFHLLPILHDVDKEADIPETLQYHVLDRD